MGDPSVPNKPVRPVDDALLWQRAQRFLAGVSPGNLPHTIGKFDQLTIKLVDGNYVRRRFFMDFNYGGHDLVYGPGNKTYPTVTFIPRNEVWLDAHVSKEALAPTLFHELIERALMKNGASYNEAHRVANVSERKLLGFKTNLMRTPLTYATVRARSSRG